MEAKRALRLFMGILVMVGILALGGCGGNGDGEVPVFDPCAGGPVPCLGEGYSDDCHLFYYWDLVDREVKFWTYSGVVTIVARYTDPNSTQPWVVYLNGPVIDCNHATITSGACDWGRDGSWDGADWFTEVSGDVWLCADWLTISEVVSDGRDWPLIYAEYVDTITLPPGQPS